MKQIPNILIRTQKTKHHARFSNGTNVRMVPHSTERSGTAQIRRPEHRSGSNPAEQAKRRRTQGDRGYKEHKRREGRREIVASNPYLTPRGNSSPRGRRVPPFWLCRTAARGRKEGAPQRCQHRRRRRNGGGGLVGGTVTTRRGRGSREARDCLHRLPVSTSGAPRYLLTTATPTPPPPPILCSSPLALSALT
jgi:hypothetical protein